MTVPARLALYAVGLLAAFAAAFFTAGAVVPEEVVQGWTSEIDDGMDDVDDDDLEHEEAEDEH